MKRAVRVTVTYDLTIEAPDDDTIYDNVGIPTPTAESWPLADNYEDTGVKVTQMDIISYDFEFFGEVKPSE
jgi:hypothetical protein